MKQQTSSRLKSERGDEFGLPVLERPEPSPPTQSAAETKGQSGLYELLVETMLDYGVAILDIHGNITAWNEGARRMTGYTQEEIIGSPIAVLYPPQDVKAQRHMSHLKVASRRGTSRDEGWRLRKDGQTFWAQVGVTALRDGTGALIGYGVMLHDCTAQKRTDDERALLVQTEHTARLKAEDALQKITRVQSVTESALMHLELEELLPDLLEKVSEILAVDTVAILLREGRSKWLRARAAKGVEEEVEQNVRIPIGRGFAGTIAERRGPVILDNVEHSMVLNPILREKGIKSLLGVPLLINGEVIGVLHVGTLTPRAFSEDDAHFLQAVADQVALAIDHARLIHFARVAREEADVAEAAVEARDEFLSVAAHELKTPMTSLRLGIDVLLSSLNRDQLPDVERMKTVTAAIDRQSHRLSRLISQLVETVRVQAGKMELRRTPTDVMEIVNDIVEQSRRSTDRHEIVVSGPPHLGGFLDGIRFEQVIANLLDNAIKFSPDGGRIDVEVAESEPGRLTLAVQDHGLGVPPENRNQLFTRFYQAHGDDYRSGMGLGLFISRQIVEQHEGTIVALFPEQGGTRFVIAMPIGPPTDEEEGREATDASR
ncbi:MAG TPA: ATP-binding protein [Chloroflexota bacterium]|nr:ATP-binding protein [Chloroflexota bacterium]